MSSTNQNPEIIQAAQGLELLVQWNNLLHEAAGGSIDSKLRAYEALEAWERARTDAEWELMRVAQFGAGKVGLRKMMKECEDVSPIGQRR